MSVRTDQSLCLFDSFKHMLYSYSNLPFYNMKTRDYDLKHRNYYYDHPSSPNHREPYLVPLENQYSILNRPHNPYNVLDHLNFEMFEKRQNPSLPYLRQQSLENEMREWNRKQTQKQNNYRVLRDELRDLSRELRRKEDQIEKEKMTNQIRNLAYSRSLVMPYPMMLPNAGMSCSMPMWNQQNSTCNHHCHPNYQCQCTCHTNISRCSKISRKKYRPMITQNTQTQAPRPSKPLVLPPSQNTISTIKSQPKVAPKQVIKLQKKKSSHLIRRFRVCAYAVYFCIYFKWFSFQFSLNRYNRFKLKYLADSGIQITNAYKEVYQKLLGIDIPGLIRTAVENVPEKRKGEKIEIESLLKAEGIKRFENLRNYRIISRYNQTLFPRCSEFISLLFERIQILFGQWEWGEFGNALGIGALDFSFMIDNYFLPHEIYLMKFHDGKGYAQITPEHERIQVMIKIIVKMLIFNVCLQLDNNKQWLQEHEKELQQNEDKDEIFIFLEISTKIMFVICQYLYERQLKGHETNYDEVQQKFKIEPCNPLVYSYSISKRRQLFKKQEVKDSNLLIFGIQNLDQINDNIQQAFFKEGKQRITNSINAAVQQIVAKLQESKRKHYSQVWEETLNNQYIVLRGIKKVMRSTKYYPFVSSSDVGSKKIMHSRKNADEQTSKTSGKKSKKNVDSSIRDSIKESSQELPSNVSKTSIMNRMTRK